MYQSTFGANSENFGYDSEGVVFSPAWAAAKKATGFFGKPKAFFGTAGSNAWRTLKRNKIEAGVIGGLAAAGMGGGYLFGRSRNRQSVAYPGGYESEYDNYSDYDNYEYNNEMDAIDYGYDDEGGEAAAAKAVRSMFGRGADKFKESKGFFNKPWQFAKSVGTDIGDTIKANPWETAAFGTLGAGTLYGAYRLGKRRGRREAEIGY